MQTIDESGNAIDVNPAKFCALLRRTTITNHIHKLAEVYGKEGQLDLENFLRAQADHEAANEDVKKPLLEKLVIFNMFKH